MVQALLLILFLLVIIGALPSLPASRKWTFMPGGALALVVLVMLLLVLVGKV